MTVHWVTRRTARDRLTERQTGRTDSRGVTQARVSRVTQPWFKDARRKNGQRKEEIRENERKRIRITIVKG